MSGHPRQRRAADWPATGRVVLPIGRACLVCGKTADQKSQHQGVGCPRRPVPPSPASGVAGPARNQRRDRSGAASASPIALAAGMTPRALANSPPVGRPIDRVPGCQRPSGSSRCKRSTAVSRPASHCATLGLCRLPLAARSAVAPRPCGRLIVHGARWPPAPRHQPARRGRLAALNMARPWTPHALPSAPWGDRLRRCGVLARRKPGLSLRLPGCFPSRLADRAFAGLLFHPPPRTTGRARLLPPGVPPGDERDRASALRALAKPLPAPPAEEGQRHQGARGKLPPLRYGSVLARRKPRLLFRSPGTSQRRKAARANTGTLSQEPPRRTFSWHCSSSTTLPPSGATGASAW